MPIGTFGKRLGNTSAWQISCSPAQACTLRSSVTPRSAASAWLARTESLLVSHDDRRGFLDHVPTCSQPISHETLLVILTRLSSLTSAIALFHWIGWQRRATGEPVWRACRPAGAEPLGLPWSRGERLACTPRPPTCDPVWAPAQLRRTTQPCRSHHRSGPRQAQSPLTRPRHSARFLKRRLAISAYVACVSAVAPLTGTLRSRDLTAAHAR